MVRACTDGPVFPGEAVQFDLIGKPPPVVTASAVPESFEAPI